MAVTINNIPVFEATIESKSEGMLKISLVDSPAVMSDFHTFGEQKPMKMAIEDEEKRLALGVLMRADFPIYRNDEQSGEYYIIFKADTIRQMAEKYLVEGRQNNVNLQHQEGTDVEGVDMVQLFIKDSSKGINPEGFDTIADGSLFAEYHITNDEVWDAIKDGTYKGFSLEGYFGEREENNKDYVEDVVKVTKGAFSQQLNNHTMKSTIKQKIKEALAAVFATFGNVTTDKGVLAWDGDEDVKVGDEVYIQNEEGETLDAPDGDYVKEDGTIIRVAGGVVTEILEKETETEGEETTAAEEVENPTNEGEESDTEAIVKLREEVNELYKKVDELTKTVEELKGKQEASDEKMAALEQSPASKSAKDEFEQQEEVHLSKADMRLQRALSIVSTLKKK